MLAGVLPVFRSGLVPLLSERLCTCHSFASRSLFASIHPSKILVYLFNRQFLELSRVPRNNCDLTLLELRLPFQHLRHTLHPEQECFIDREVVPILRFKDLVSSVASSPLRPSPSRQED